MTSCVINKPMERFDQQMVQMWQMEKETGIKYYLYNNKIVNETQYDSLIGIEVDSVIIRISKM
jgi:hypothetical protein